MAPRQQDLNLVPWGQDGLAGDGGEDYSSVRNAPSDSVVAGAKEKAALMKIGVFCHDGEAVLGGILPDSIIAGHTDPTARTCVESG